MTNEEAIERLRVLKVFDAPDLREAVNMAISALSRDRWISVEDALPDFEGAVLCMRKSYIHPGMRHQEIMYVDEHGFCNIDDIYAGPGDVTHWMPLPEPPKEET